jgi:transmembrane sensor
MNEAAPLVEVERAEEAARWCMRLAEGQMSQGERRSFRHWLDEANNATAFVSAASTWAEVHDVQAAPEVLPLRLEALAALQREQRQRARLLLRRPRLRRALLAVAGAVTIAVALAVWWQSRPELYRTLPGERRTVSLEDGTELSLDANSEVSVHYSTERRSLTLIRGRAEFRVAKDPLRPLSVTAADRTVVAVGTAFSVELAQNTVRIVLYEGHVSIVGPLPTSLATGDPRMLAANGSRQIGVPQELITPGVELVGKVGQSDARVEPIDPVRSLSWQMGKLEFIDEPLGLAVERVNRYSTEPLQVKDPKARALLISGVFVTGDTRAFIEGVTAAFPVKLVDKEFIFTR